MSDPNRKAEKAAKHAEQQRRFEEETAGLTFEAFPKITRLNRDIVITEKIDGTNAAIGIQEVIPADPTQPDLVQVQDRWYRIYAQSRTVLLTPERDNFGFASWVRRHALSLVLSLGEGLHFGEWWGHGIQRGYGKTDRTFSLFNTQRWMQPDQALKLEMAQQYGAQINVVPVLYTGPWKESINDAFMPQIVLEILSLKGSSAAPGFMQPEGIVVNHVASRTLFKVTVERDAEWKGKTA